MNSRNLRQQFSFSERFAIIALVNFLSLGCSISVGIIGMDSIDSPLEQRSNPDFVNGEIVVTSASYGSQPGYKINGAMGEVSGSQVTTSNYKIQGVFYDLQSGN